jgi:hypothetical protein
LGAPAVVAARLRGSIEKYHACEVFGMPFCRLGMLGMPVRRRMPVRLYLRMALRLRLRMPLRLPLPLAVRLP